MYKPTLPSWARGLGVSLPGLSRTALLAVLCNLALELSQLAAVEGYAWRYKTPAFILLFLLGSLALWLVVGLVHAVVGRFWLTSALVLTATAVVAFADYEKIRLRREPLYPSDWEFAGNIGFLVGTVGVRGVLLLATGALVLAVAAYMGSLALRRRFPRGAHQPRRPMARRTQIVVRVLTAGLCLVGLGYLADFNSPGNAARDAYEALGASWRPWSQQRNYLGNGFVAGTLYNLDVPAMAPPAGYSSATMNRIAARYTADAAEINRSRDPRVLDDVNVVMILSESFSDPKSLRGVHLAEDPIPFIRRLMGSTTSGPMLAQNVGGGTANMEFEALTGMSASQFPPQLVVPYQMLVPGHETFPSAVRWLKQDGHRAVAVHPYTAEMYRRREVYRAFGFDDFVYDRTMHNKRRIGHDAYISDATAFDLVQRRLSSVRDPLLMNVVTMQNHMPYAGKYDDPASVTGPDGESMPEIGQYVRGLTYTDHAVQELIDGLSGLDEPTVVVFYGDHLPGSYPDDVFNANGRPAMHETPFFVWANFPGEKREQPITSPIYFMDLVLERANAAVPPYYALLHELRHEIPAMDSGMIFDVHNRPLRQGQLSDRAALLLRDYRLVQYDLSVGKRYSEDAMFGADR